MTSLNFTFYSSVTVLGQIGWSRLVYTVYHSDEDWSTLFTTQMKTGLHILPLRWRLVYAVCHSDEDWSTLFATQMKAGLHCLSLRWRLVYTVCHSLCIFWMHFSMVKHIFSSPACCCSHPCHPCPRHTISFMFEFFKTSYLDNHSSESIHIWTYPGGQLPFHDSCLTQGPCPRVGLQVRI